MLIPIIKNELRLYIYSWLGWSALIMINVIAAIGYLFGAVRFGNFQYFFSLLEMPFALSILIVGSRTLAKDKELGMFSLFFTAPLPLSNILWAKFLALVIFFSTMALGLIFYAVVSSLFFTISWATVFTGLVSLLCGIVFFSSLALFASSCAENTLISIVIGFGLWILIYLLGSIGNMMDPNLPWTTLVREISYTAHYQKINSGVFSLGDLMYFVVVTLFMMDITESKILSQVAY